MFRCERRLAVGRCGALQHAFAIASHDDFEAQALTVVDQVLEQPRLVTFDVAVHDTRFVGQHVENWPDRRLSVRVCGYDVLAGPNRGLRNRGADQEVTSRLADDVDTAKPTRKQYICRNHGSADIERLLRFANIACLNDAIARNTGTLKRSNRAIYASVRRDPGFEVVK